MDSRIKTLVDIIARTDAPLRPWRDPSTPAWGAICARQSNWPTHGVAWLGGGGDAARKEAERTAQDFKREGLIELLRKKHDRALGVRLAPRTEENIRALCGLPGLIAALERLRDLMEIEQTVGTMAGE